MPLSYDDLMEEANSLRKQLDFLLKEHTIISLDIRYIKPYPQTMQENCYYHPKRKTEAIGMYGLVVIRRDAEPGVWKPALIISIYIYADYSLYFRGDEELIDILKPFFVSYKDTICSKYDNQYKAQKFIKTCKRELMEKVWHPKRLSAWLDAGVDLDGI